jgi:hypothetical protein
MIPGPEFVLIITIFLPPKTVHHKVKYVPPVTVNELHRTYESCMARGREIDKIVKQKHRWSCHEVDTD